jgi:hypothetical protein
LPSKTAPATDVNCGAAGERSQGDSLVERVAAPRDGEWEENESEEDSFEKTFASGSNLTHFRVNERRCGVGDLDFSAAGTAIAADPGEA